MKSRGNNALAVWLAVAALCGVLTTALKAESPAETDVTRLTGTDLSAWRGDTGMWTVVGDVVLDRQNTKSLASTPGDGVILNGPTGRTSNLISQAEFGDVRAHLEFIIPVGSNSGVYFMGRYEIQIYDSHGVEKDEYAGIECGGIYERWDESRTPKGFEGHSPRVNASRPPGQWQSFDVVFRAPRFDDQGRKIANARFEKVLHNGVVVHEDMELTGPTRGSTYNDEKTVGPLMLQGDHGPIAYRNISISPAGAVPLFAMDTGTRDGNHNTARQQVDMLKELGYDGMGCTAGEGLAEMVAALDDTGLRPVAAYVGANIDEDQPKFGPELKAAIETLKGRNSILWLFVRSNKLTPSSSDGDARAVEIIREIADMAEPNKVRIALYPHHGFWVERVEDAVRVATKVDRPNVGVTFNLCHWLRSGDDQPLRDVLKQAMPRLFVVSINGADREGKSWKELIQTLDRGSFDTQAFLKTLFELGYHGPIGLQGYGIGGDAHDNLERSMRAWQTLSARLEKEKN